MCEINPKHKKSFRLEVYTSHNIEKNNFIDTVSKILLSTEVNLNTEYPMLRFHIHEEEDKT